MKRKRSRRRSRKNSWFGQKRRHSKAAKLGMRRRRSGRRTRRNAGAHSLSFGSVSRSATSALKVNVLKDAGVILGGNILTTWSAEKIMGAIPALRSNKFANVATVLMTAGLAGVFTRRFAPKYANSVLIGGALAGVTRGIRTLAPNLLPSSCLGDDMDGLSEDLDGLADWMASPGNIARAFPLHGIGSYAHIGQPVVGTGYMGDYANMGQSGQQQFAKMVQLDGMDAVGEEIASQM